MAEINDLTTSDALNTARFPEAMAPSAVNNGARDLEGILARWHRDNNGSLAGALSASGTYAVTLNQHDTSGAFTLYDGLTIAFDAAGANTFSGGISLLKVTATGGAAKTALSIVKSANKALGLGDIQATQKVSVVLDGVAGNFQMLNPSAADENFNLNATGGVLTDSLALESIDAGAGIAPSLVLHRNSASPADADLIGSVDFDGEDDGSVKTTYARVHALIDDVTGGTEDGSLLLSTLKAATLTEAVRVTNLGEVGIGIATPDGTLHVHTATAGTVAAPASSDDFIIENSSDAGMSIFSPDANTSRITFGAPGGAEFAEIIAVYSAGSSYLRFDTANSEVMRVFNGTVGIGGIATPDGTLHVHTSTAGTASAVDDADDLVVESSANTGITILSGNTANSTIAFGDDGDADIGKIDYDHNDNSMAFVINATEAARVTSAGFVGIGIATPDGTLHVHTSSAGTVTAIAGADDLVVESSAATGITILSANDSTGTLAFGDDGSNTVGRILYNHVSNIFNIRTRDAETLRIGGVASGVNFFNIANGATGNSPELQCLGETDVSMIFRPKGAGIARFESSNTITSGSVLINQASTGDASLQMSVAATNFIMGIDNSEADIFKMDTGNAIGGSTALQITVSNDVIIGDRVALATDAINGFLFIPGCAGTPTGTVAFAAANAVALVYDTTNNILYANDGAWKSIQLI